MSTNYGHHHYQHHQQQQQHQLQAEEQPSPPSRLRRSSSRDTGFLTTSTSSLNSSSIYPSSKGGTKLTLINLTKHTVKPKRDQFIENASYEKSKQRSNQYSKTEEAIRELEDLYHSLNLSEDEDLLDRAERRDLPSRIQMMKFEGSSSSSSSSSSSASSSSSRSFGSEIDFHLPPQSSSSYSPSSIYSNYYSNYEPQRYRVKLDPLEAYNTSLPSHSSHHNLHHNNHHHHHNHNHRDLSSINCHQQMITSSKRAPSLRRSAIPDKIYDDLAFRRYSSQPNLNHSRRQTISSSFMDLSTMTTFPSYLLYSSAYIPPLDLNYCNHHHHSRGTLNSYHHQTEPNIDKDDLFYRRLKQAEGANVLPRPPPFGIPLRYVCDPNSTNYVHYHLDPKERKKVYFRVKPSSPHIIRDDMAFRNYRKDAFETPPDSPRLLPVTTTNVFFSHLLSQV